MKLKMPGGSDEGVDVEICMGPYHEMPDGFVCSCCGLKQAAMENHVHPLIQEGKPLVPAFNPSHHPRWEQDGTAICRLCGCRLESPWGLVTDAGRGPCGAKVSP